MSRQYKINKEVPTDVLARRLDELSDYITKHDMPSEFSMRIPAEVDHDADLVLAECARRLRIYDQICIHAATTSPESELA